VTNFKKRITDQDIVSAAKIKLTPEELYAFAQYVHEISGINLSPNKAYLIESRMSELLTEYRCSTFTGLLHMARLNRDRSLQKNIIDRMTTNETFFFRNNGPFQLLQHKILPDLIDKRTAPDKDTPVPIKIWSAACSTGQEVYSIAIVLKELLADLDNYHIKLLGTDIYSRAIAKASSGTYSKFEVARGLTKEMLHTYFLNQNNGWQIRDEVRGMVHFGKRNLMQPFDGIGVFDIIFCRNVAIYFSKTDRQKFFEKIARVLSPDGYLILGSTESMLGLSTCFEPREHLQTIFYQKNRPTGN